MHSNAPGDTVPGTRIAANEDIGICVSNTATSTVAGGLPLDLAATKVDHSNDCSL